MKKILFALMAAALFCGCGKDDGGSGAPCPVTDVSIPASGADNPVKPDDAVTIQGKGFAADCEIWLRAASRAAEVQATVTGRTATSVTFTAPRVYGSQSVVLKQEGGAWVLGKLTFAEASMDLLPRKIVRIDCCYEDEYGSRQNEERFSYDGEGRLIGSSYGGTVDYSGANKVVYTYGEPGYVYRATFELNSGGRAVNCVEVEEEEYSGDDRFTTGYTYGGDGRLTGFETVDSDNGNVDGALTWDKNGCLVKFVSDYKAPDDSYKYTLTIVPDMNAPNNLNLDLMGNVDFCEAIDEDCISDGFLFGLIGKRTAYLPQSITYKDSEGDTSVTTYEYGFDGEYISEIVVREEYDNSTLTMRLYYE